MFLWAPLDGVDDVADPSLVARAQPTRTLNPLPFHDLEPHRFEDLVRGLAHGFRRWESLEATGRGGSDDGMDIRGVELVDAAEEPPGEDADGATYARAPGRPWLFQCKREKSLAGSAIKKIADECLPAGTLPPYGFVLAAACDVSKKARDVFRQEMVSRGVQEFHLWARGELEDMLFRPANDTLLFAFFGISLTARRRSQASTIRSRVALKKQIRALFEKDESSHSQLLLVRDAHDDTYPDRPDAKSAARWMLCELVHTRSPHTIVVVAREHLAWVTPDRTGWDALVDVDVGQTFRHRLLPHGAWSSDDRVADPRESAAFDFWNEYVPEDDRAYLKVARGISYERVVAIDPIGDGFYPVPHFYVDWAGHEGPFTPQPHRFLWSAQFMNAHHIDLAATGETRRRLFPANLPQQVFPTPSDLDVRPTASELSTSSTTELDELLLRIPTTEQPTASTYDWRAQHDERFSAFRAWREVIALPVMAAFVERLRASGHDARIAQRPSGPQQRPFQGGEYVELRVRFSRPDGALRTGYFRVTSDWSEAVKITCSPAKEVKTERYRPPAQRPRLDEVSPEWLEKEIVDLLRRM